MVKLSSELIKLRNAEEEIELKDIINEFKASNFNYFIKYDTNNFFGYNFLNRSILRIPSHIFPLIDQFFIKLASEDIESKTSILPSKLPSQWIEALIDSNFIIDRNIDELSLVKFRYYSSLYANDSLKLIILPTLWCNLACPYCFEFKRPIFMKPGVQDALIGWIKNNYKEKRNVHISWFGGEPLLAKNVIFNLTKHFKKFCHDIGADYKANLTTNGYYLDHKFMDAIPSLNINNVQITMDGDKPDHDALKKKINGGGSFDRIFQNIVTFCENVTDCHLSIRINCCDDNYDGVVRLLDRFPLVVRDRASIYFRWVYSNKASGYREFSRIKQGTEPFLGLANLYSNARSLGWKFANDPENNEVDGYCEVDYLDHYAISPDGNVFLCSHSYEKSESIGYLQKDDMVVSPRALGTYTRWYSVNPFDDNFCLACQLLPLCMGGCRKARAEGRRNCILGQKSLDVFVKNIINEILILKLNAN